MKSIFFALVLSILYFSSGPGIAASEGEEGSSENYEWNLTSTDPLNNDELSEAPEAMMMDFRHRHHNNFFRGRSYFNGGWIGPRWFNRGWYTYPYPYFPNYFNYPYYYNSVGIRCNAINAYGQWFYGFGYNTYDAQLAAWNNCILSGLSCQIINCQ